MLYVRDLKGAQALEVGQLINRFYGYGIISGGEVTEGAEPFSVEIPATEVLVDETRHSVPTQSVNLEEYVHEKYPRKVAIYVDIDGTVQVKAGDAEPAQPNTEIRDNTYRPAPPDFITETDQGVSVMTHAAVLATVWLGANDERVVDDDIKDRRLPSELVIHTADITQLSFDEVVDGAGTRHTGALADASDVPSNSDILSVVNADDSHGTDASHNYRTDAEIQAAVEGGVDAGTLLSTGGSAGQFLRSNADDSASWADIPALEAPTIDEGVVSHTGGGSTDVTITNVSTNEAALFDVNFGMESGLAADYEWNYEWSREWDSANGYWVLHVTFTWAADNDPGSGTDASIAYVVYDAAPQAVTGRFTENDAIQSIDGANITPAVVDISQALELPVYDDLSNHPGPTAGDMAVATGNGSDTWGLYLYNAGANSGAGAWQGPVETDATPTLSDLVVDTHKDWGGFQIRNLAAPNSADAAARKAEVDSVQSNLDSHASASDPHGTAYSDEEAQDAVGAAATDGLAYDDDANALGLNVVADDGGTPVSLSEGSAVVDTGHAVDGGYYFPLVSPRSAGDIAASLEDDSNGTGNYRLHIEEHTTTNNPDVGWALVSL